MAQFRAKRDLLSLWSLLDGKTWVSSFPASPTVWEAAKRIHFSPASSTWQTHELHGREVKSWSENSREALWPFKALQGSSWGRPGGTVVIPGSGRSSGVGNGNPPQYSCLENSMNWRSLAGCSPWGRRESDTTACMQAHTRVLTNGAMKKLAHRGRLTHRSPRLAHGNQQCTSASHTHHPRAGSLSALVRATDC